MSSPRYPLLYQVNTRVWLAQLSKQLGRLATLDDIPNAELDSFAQAGFDWIWLLSVWQTGPQARDVSRAHPGWRREFEQTLPDLTEEDIPGSGFAITDYRVHKQLGGDASLARLRKRLAQRGLKLMLDFVPNHMGLGHRWVDEHPEYFVAGTEADHARAPQNYIRVASKKGKLLLAHGRDPYFDGWPDTLQLNYAQPTTQAAMIGELQRIAGQCDGLRCDMAMLVLPEVFERTWGAAAPLFWTGATEQVRKRHPGFTFMAEVYWDLEWTLQQQGFDYAYDKRLYDRLRERHARPVREHLYAGRDFQDKLARFLENHDEPRAAATFPRDVHAAAAAITFLSPGLRFFHQGQFEGRKVRISPHLGRGPEEPLDGDLQAFYASLLAVLKNPAFRDGDWRLLPADRAWEGNASHEDFVLFAWRGADDARFVVAVNYASHPSQCRVRLPWSDLAGRSWRLADLLSRDVYDRPGDELTEPGLFLDMRPWQAAVYEIARP